jgi:hypothetical protein
MKTPLPKTFHIGGYWRGPNDVVRHMMLGLRAAGAEVFECNSDERREALDCEGRPYDRGTFGPAWLRWNVLRASIEQFQPDLIVCNAGGLSFRPEIAERLRRSTRLLGISLSDPDVFAPATSSIALNFDLFLTNAPACVSDYQALGVNVMELPPATNAEFFQPVAARPELDCEVLVIGRAHLDRIEPVRRIAERFRLHLYGEGWESHSRGSVYGDDLLLRLELRSNCPDFRTDGGPVMRFQREGCLTFLRRGRWWPPNGSGGWSDTCGLTAKSSVFIPPKPEAVRRAGRQRVLSQHTWKMVWPRIVEELPHKGTPGC